MEYFNEVRLVGELIDNPQERMVEQNHILFFQLKTDDQIHYCIAKNELARKVGVSMRQGKIFFIIGKLNTVQVPKNCSRCSTDSDNRLTRIICSEVVCLGDGSHYTQKFLTL